MKRLIPAIFLFILGHSLLGKGGPIYTSYLWHLQQPIYWPDKHPNFERYQYANDSISLKQQQQGHPLNNLTSIFSKDDRVAVYQYRIPEALKTIQWHPNAGAQVTYSGCLMENIQSLGEHYSLGYSPHWNQPIKNARSWETSGGHPRLDLILFTYHHALPGLIDPLLLKREIEIYKEVYAPHWGDHPSLSRGFFPAEMAFSERIIPTLVELGIEWVVVSNSHISRAIKNFPLQLGSGGENTEPPNKADQINPPQDQWFQMKISRGCAPTNAYPYSMRPHYAKYVNPTTGKEYKIIVVPAEQAMSWEDGYKIYGTSDIDRLAAIDNHDDPMLMLFAHDGDNAFGGGYSYYMEGVNKFVSEANHRGYHPTTIQQYLTDHPVDPEDIVHVEDGAWVNADGDMGSPTFSNWNWPLVNKKGEVDIANGWAEDERNWAVYTAALNRVATSEHISGIPVKIKNIVNPATEGSNVEKAWHFLLGGLASGYMYYGKVLDMESKPAIACNRAVEYADTYLTDLKADKTPPTIWLPQRYPYNPGGLNYGAIYGYKKVLADNSFWVWTFIHDVSGLKSVRFYYRVDKDGENSLSSNKNEVYAASNEVGPWQSKSMTPRIFPKGNVFNDPEIKFVEEPHYIADQYSIHIDEERLQNVLIDYYVEAIDNNGNIARSPIQHMWIGASQD